MNSTMRKLIGNIIIATIFSIIFLQLAVFAQIGDPVETGPPPLENFLQRILSATGLAAVAGSAYAAFLQYVPTGYNDVDTKWKRAVFGGICILLTAMAIGLGAWLYQWEPSPELIWQGAYASWAAWTSGTTIAGYLPRKDDGRWSIRGF